MPTWKPFGAQPSPGTQIAGWPTTCLAPILTRKGQTDEAISQYQEGLRLKPDYAGAYSNLGVALARKGQMDEAISQYQEALRLKPDFAEPTTVWASLSTTKAKPTRRSANSRKPSA